jgi:hypothetical protein
MKKLYTILIAIFLTASTFAQFPQKMSYQAVIRNAADELVTNHSVGIRVSVLKGSVSGTTVYTETQTPTTNDNGLISIEIGGETGFDAITWANGPYFIKTETDPTGGTNYTISGTSQLLSVPYALHAKTAEEIQNPLWFSNFNGINTEEFVGIGTSTPDANLHIVDHTGESPLKMESDDNIYTIWKSNRSGVDDYMVGIDGGNNRFMFANLANAQMLLTLKGAYVGISQPNPEANLDVSGSFKLSDGSEGIGKVLTSDDLGNASWQMPGNATEHYIGESYGGGIVIWVDETGQHGLIAAASDQSTGMQWYGASYTATNAVRDGIGGGMYNTERIIASQGAGSYAAQLCANYKGSGYGDWYLPSKYELNLLYLQSDVLGGLEGNYYWSSTEDDNNNVWHQDSSGGDQNLGSKEWINSVRAVRTF